MSEYAPDEPASFDAIVERQPFEPAKESADPFSSGREGIQEAADEVSRGRETKETLRRFVRDPDDPASSAPRDVTISAETAADALRENRNLEAQYEQSELDRVTSAAVDDLRGEQPAQPTQQPQIQPELVPQAEVPPAEPTVLDEMLQELPQHRRAPFVAAFMEHMDRAAHQARTGYDQAVAQANAVQQQYQQAAIETVRVAESVARAPFAELHSVPNEQLPAVMAHIQRTQPARFAEIQNHVASVRNMVGQQLTAVQQAQLQNQAAVHEQQQQQQRQAAVQFQQWAAAEDSKVDRLLAAETPEHRFAIQQEAAAILREDGMTDQQIQHLWQNDPTFRSAPAQKLLLREAKSRLAARGVRAARVTPVPHVARPGTSEDAVDRSAYADLSREMRGRDLSVKDAAKLLIARRSSR